MATSIRRGTEADAAQAAELYLRARDAAVPDIPARVHDDEDVRRWFAEHVVRERELWLAEHDPGRLAGILVLDGEFVDQLYVDPELTGRGIGRALLDHAKQQRPAGLRLWTFQANDGARRFYERERFVALRFTDGAENEERAPDVLYVYRPPHP